MLSRLRYGRLAPLWRLVQQRDDFDWTRYTGESYQNELVALEREHTILLKPTDAANGQIVIQGKPLHPNHRLIYETVLRLQPRSILEVGAGGGDHLANLSTLFPVLRCAAWT